MTKYILHITPQTWVRYDKRDKKAFTIPEAVLIEKYPSLYKRKKYIERYALYKEQLFEEAVRRNFLMGNAGLEINFRIPAPKSWRPGKKRKFHMQPHLPKPDVDNLLKAMLDSLRPKHRGKDDASIWNLKGLTKTWVDFPIGWIEIIDHGAPVIIKPAEINENLLF